MFSIYNNYLDESFLLSHYYYSIDIIILLLLYSLYYHSPQYSSYYLHFLQASISYNSDLDIFRIQMLLDAYVNIYLNHIVRI